MSNKRGVKLLDKKSAIDPMQMMDFNDKMEQLSKANCVRMAWTCIEKG